MRILSILLLISSLSLASVYTKENRVTDMHFMADAMLKIQNGFFFNNLKMVQDGALQLSDSIRHVQTPIEEIKEKDPMSRYKNSKVKFTNKLVKYIDKRVQILIERFEAKDHQQSVQAYTKILKKCMLCHTEIRKW